MNEYDFSPILMRIKSEKKKAGMTNDELSLASGVPIGTLRKILSGGTTEPKLPALMSIASALNTSVDYLVYGKSQENEKKPAPIGNELDAELLKKLMSLTPDEIAKVDAFVQGLLASR